METHRNLSKQNRLNSEYFLLISWIIRLKFAKVEDLIWLFVEFLDLLTSESYPISILNQIYFHETLVFFLLSIQYLLNMSSS